jgi:hypothetical protein
MGLLRVPDSSCFDPGNDIVLIFGLEPPAARPALSREILQSEPHAAVAVERTADPILEVLSGLKDAVHGGAAISSQGNGTAW